LPAYCSPNERQGIGMLGNAFAKGPIFARDLNKVDANILFAHPASAAKSSAILRQQQ